MADARENMLATSSPGPSLLAIFKMADAREKTLVTAGHVFPRFLEVLVVVMKQLLLIAVLSLMFYQTIAKDIARNNGGDLEKRVRDPTESDLGEPHFAVKREACLVRYKKVRCFKDTKVFKELLFTDRDPSSRMSSGKSIDWKNFGAYLKGLACRCAKAAKMLSQLNATLEEENKALHDKVSWLMGQNRELMVKNLEEKDQFMEEERFFSDKFYTLQRTKERLEEQIDLANKALSEAAPPKKYVWFHYIAT
ncbi:hypothetical protein QZH41_019766 [Actinostola sp. cb2023]|nr:hypothetical protein QZH41_019766 [Actinostola sp. cb2023]